MLSSADWFWALFGEVEYDDWGIDSRYLTTIRSALLRVWFRGVGVGVGEERSRVMIGAVVPSGCKCFYYVTYYTYYRTRSCGWIRLRRHEVQVLRETVKGLQRLSKKG